MLAATTLLKVDYLRARVVNLAHLRLFWVPYSKAIICNYLVKHLVTDVLPPLDCVIEPEHLHPIGFKYGTVDAPVGMRGGWR
jgi:hypothetical protein